MIEQFILFAWLKPGFLLLPAEEYSTVVYNNDNDNNDNENNNYEK